MKFLKRIIFGAVIVYLAIAALMFFKQRSFQYFPPNFYISPQAAGHPDFTEIALSSNGAKIIGWYAPPQNEAAPVIMFFHGNGSAIYSNTDIFADLTAQGYGVFSVGYAGYPGSGGELTQAAIVDGAKQQREWLEAQGISSERIIYFGTSMGSGVAAQLAVTDPPALLIMDAPFNSMLDMGKRMMPVLPVKLLMKDKFRSDLALQNYQGPMIWTHGRQDQIVPISQGQKLYDGYAGPKSAHIFEGGRHTNLWGLGARDIVLSRLRGHFSLTAPQDHTDIKSGQN